MRIAVAAVLFCAAALPCAAQDYYETMATAKNGYGYVPGTIAAGWERQDDYTVIAITRDGVRKEGGEAWKAVVTTGPNERAGTEDDDDDDRYLDRRATTPQAAARPAGPKPVRKEVSYSSLTCPAVMARIEALKPLATFEFNLPGLKGNEDGGAGDGHQGLDLWIRIGGGELSRSAENINSNLGRWFQATAAALDACPATAKAP